MYIFSPLGNIIEIGNNLYYAVLWLPRTKIYLRTVMVTVLSEVITGKCIGVTGMYELRP